MNITSYQNSFRRNLRPIKNHFWFVRQAKYCICIIYTIYCSIIIIVLCKLNIVFEDHKQSIVHKWKIDIFTSMVRNVIYMHTYIHIYYIYMCPMIQQRGHCPAPYSVYIYIYIYTTRGERLWTYYVGIQKHIYIKTSATYQTYSCPRD